MTDHLGLDNLYRNLSLEKINSPFLSSHWQSLDIHLGIEPGGISSFNVGISTGIIIMPTLFM